jgi:antirestriction protein ArdC
MSYTRNTRADTPARDHYADVTNRIVASLESGTMPWRRPWNPDKAGGGPMSPRNAVTGRRYHGINVLMLGMTGMIAAADDPRWLTYKQAQQRGWQVRPGERGSRVFFFRKLTVQDNRGEATSDGAGEREGEGTRTIPLLRAYTVFHASQVDGISSFEPPTQEEAAWRTPEAADIILRNSGATIKEGGDRAFYAPASDHIQLPPRASFENPQSYAAVALHEAGHWTGAPKRMNRNLSGRFGSQAYSVEELHAELASCFIASEVGLPCDIPNHASYLGSWIDVLKSDKREIFRAAADAQRIADFLLAFHPDHASRLAAENREDETPGNDG